MRAAKRKRLEARGWTVGSVKEFLDLSDQESAYIELRLKLARGLKARRHARGFSQTQLAKAVQSSQSRVAKMESGDPTSRSICWCDHCWLSERRIAISAESSAGAEEVASPALRTFAPRLAPAHVGQQLPVDGRA